MEKKEKTIEIAGLARVEMRPVDKDCAALILTDATQETTGYLITPECVKILLAPLLGLAAQWAHLEEVSIETLVGPQHALLASRVVVEKGRTDTEGVLRVFVGKTELTFLIPLSVVTDLQHTMEAFLTKETLH